ncbi:MAG TPA: isoprenylcysteine carboxylmethyltransferase family protein, partial [Sphingomonas sp.]|nr:isoprenylcysteine carboxylmethyltransferase family protein [Sphingomonas sp.]
MTRLFFLLFGILAYAVFLAVFLYLIGFVADLDALPRTIDRGPGTRWTFALLVDIGLIGLFGIQHSVMARPAFKREWTRIVPVALERSIFLLASSAVLALVFWLWRPIP